METMAEMMTRVRAETRERLAQRNGVSLNVALRANEAARGLYHGTHGRPADAATGLNVVGAYAEAGPPDGVHRMDKANKGWAGAWQRQNTTRAGKSERKSVRVGSQTGGQRGETDQRTADQRYGKGIL